MKSWLRMSVVALVIGLLVVGVPGAIAILFVVDFLFSWIGGGICATDCNAEMTYLSVLLGAVLIVSVAGGIWWIVRARREDRAYRALIADLEETDFR